MTEAELEETIAQLRCGWAKQKARLATPDAEYDAARAALEARLPAFEQARAKIEAQEDAPNEAFDRLGDAERAIFEAAPTTHVGAVAMLRFTADFLEELGINDTRVEDVLRDALRRAADFIELKAA
ncbi:MAG TPA: hypothetical protein VMJ31_09245 [Methylocystis sp.]|nr:hypothetical protein [Methylocystis sp.]